MILEERRKLKRLYMAIELKEILGYSVQDAGKYNQSLPSPSKDTDINESYREFNKDELYTSNKRVLIEAIHCYPFATRNFTRYMPDACKASTESWVEPYNRPVIMYHNDYDGEITGRVVGAEVKISEKTGGECLFLTATAPEWRTWERIENEIYKTTSIGVAATDVRCSICGAKLAEGEECEHRKGFSYDGEICYWDVYEFDPKEISYVITPSDPYSQIISLGMDTETEKESYDSSKTKVTDVRQHTRFLTNKENKTKDTNKEKNNNIMDISEDKYNELIQTKEALEVEKKVLSNEKAELAATIKNLNKNKLDAQESIKNLNQTIADKDTEIDAIKQAKESLEEENKKLLGEVKTSIVGKITSMRESAGLPKIDNLEDRSIDMLRVNLADLEADIAARDVINSRESVTPEGLSKNDNPTMKESENKSKEDKKQENQKTVFDL